MLDELRRRGDGRRESGAFLLGEQGGAQRRVLWPVYYDDVDPGSLDAGYVHLRRRAYTALWARCRALGLEVVADVHTHPARAFLSDADRAHPTIPRSGHIAVIVPDFAQGPFHSQSVARYGVYTYRGGLEWDDHSGPGAPRFFYVGRWG